MDLSPEVIEQFDDQDLDQYLPPPGMPHPLVQHNPHHSDSSYPGCYLTNSMQAASSGLSGWTPSYRMTSGSSSSCLPHYVSQTSSHVTTHTMQTPYDLSEQTAPDTRSPPTVTASATSRGSTSQTSPQNLATTDNFLNAGAPECKYRNDDACSIKMEQQQSQAQSLRQASNLQSSFRCDSKFDTSSFSGSQPAVRYSVESGQNAYSHMAGPYVPQNGSGVHGNSTYQYNMGLHRQGMFSAIPAAVPTEQSWERFG